MECKTGTIIARVIIKLKEKKLKQALRNLKMEKLPEKITYLLNCASIHQTNLKQGY
jgi:hypothetical protein